MNAIPQRQSLVIQTADYLREAMERGEWREILPGHRTLCAQLQVSSYTLNLALHALKNEGLLEIAQGRRIRIIRRRRRPSKRVPPRTVVALTTRQLEELEPRIHYFLTKIQHHLQVSGFEFRLHIDPRLQWQHLPRQLEALVAKQPVACWILMSVNSFTQHWFMSRGLPAILSGTPDSDVRLPAFALDTAGLCRDAAKRFLSLGHRHVALLTFDSSTVGDKIGEQVFLQTIREEGGSRIRVDTIHHDRTVDGICNAVDSVLSSRDRATGILSAGARHSLTVVGHLQRRGIQLPGEMSVVARDYSSFLYDSVPSISGYEMEEKLLAESFPKMVVTLAQSKVLPCQTKWIDWRFVRGDTLGPVRSRN